MTAAQNPPADRTRQILEDLEAVRENLLALSDDIWLSIDHNDSEALEDGVQFKRAYNEKVTAFDQLAAELSTLVQQYTSIRLESAEQTGSESGTENERIIRELDRELAHSLDEDLTYKRPHGFILAGQATVGITTWQRLFELVCRQLCQRDRGRFRALVDNADFISNRGHHSVTHDPRALRKSLEVDGDLFVESNLSANGIRDTLRHLLAAFELPGDQLKLFLRQDRDAGREIA